MKFVCSQNCVKFREYWKGFFRKGFICPADTFDNVSGAFPIAFTIWHLDGTEEVRNVSVDVFDRDSQLLGTKVFHSSIAGNMISDWLRRFYDAHSGATLAYMSLPGVSMQQRASLFITSKPTESDVKQHKVARITQRNLIPFAVYLAVRHCITLTWENSKDEFCHPNDDWISDEEFKCNCLVFVLFDNVVKSADGVNHWIPFAEAEVNAKSCFKSHFMSDLINGSAVSTKPPQMGTAASSMQPCQGELFSKPSSLNPVVPVKNASASLRLCVKGNLSPAARAVLEAGRELWRYYHAQPNANPNASYYDIRLHFQGMKKTASGKEQMNATSSDETYNALLANLRAAHKTLAAQIVPKVYAYGFLKR